ncbi:gamma-glutamylcyclotransferase [Roseiconus nitratireducens]|uniref:Gamma-glutamylcyclotransferase n=1 Tax=Roseiconus nitratireducens TaxID=2605748 RepID=A0A5M6D4F8_9BACT|nr:gamma-glutamylcyclotransferase family protein [Roseiconus nitratireducens]KAA5541470.1 gamma-glutamylcyclotransferase [Roseiconus nitratireducens]
MSFPRGVFVYGTLKRGQCREHAWPAVPRDIRPAWIRARLFGRADYPAITAGEDRVVGELWTFDDGQMDSVLRVLDQIEGTSGNQPHDLYHRHVVQVSGLDDHPLGDAYTYFYNSDPARDGFQPVAVANGCSRWDG